VSLQSTGEHLHDRAAWKREPRPQEKDQQPPPQPHQEGRLLALKRSRGLPLELVESVGDAMRWRMGRVGGRRASGLRENQECGFVETKLGQESDNIYFLFITKIMIVGLLPSTKWSFPTIDGNVLNIYEVMNNNPNQP
jgi:hypothetical protein